MSLYIGETQIGRVVVGAPRTTSDVFVVTVSWDDDYFGTGEGAWIPNKTFAQIQAAYQAGKEITVQVNVDSDFASADGEFENNAFAYWVRAFDDGIIEYNYQYTSSGLVLYDQNTYIATPADSITITSNDTYDVTNYAEAVVNVSFGASHTSSDLIVSGPTVTAPAGVYASAASANVASGSVTAPSSISGTSATISTGTNTLTLTKTVSVTPNVTTPGYITSGTAGNSDISLTASVNTRSSSDLTASGATVTAPAGYYAAAATKTITSGSATTPATTITTNPTISVNSSTGLITASNNKTQSVTPTVSPGYVSSGTSGTITVSGSNTSQLTVQGAQTIHPSSTDQTISSGRYLTGTQTINAVTTSNLIADNIKSGVTIKIGDASDDDCVMSVTGTYAGSGGSSTGWTVADVVVDGFDDEYDAVFQFGTTINNLAAWIIYADETISNPSNGDIVAVLHDSTGTKAWGYNNGNALEIDSLTIQAITSPNNIGQVWVALNSSDAYQFVIASYHMIIVYGGSGTLTFNTATYAPPSGVTSGQFSVSENPPLYFIGLGTSVAANQYHRVQTVVKCEDENIFSGTNFYTSTLGYYSNFTETYNNDTLTVASNGTNGGGYFHNPGTYTLYYFTEDDLSGSLYQKKTVTPTTSTQQIQADSGYLALSKVTVNPIPSEYIIPSGNLSITANGNNINVASYSTVSVNVSGGSGGGSSKAIQINSNAASVRTNGYTSTGISITVEKSGTYNVSWIAWRSSSSGTMGTNLHKNNTAGTNQQTWTNTYGQHITLSNQTYAAGDVLTLYATAGSTSRYCWAGNLIIEEQ